MPNSNDIKNWAKDVVSNIKNALTAQSNLDTLRDEVGKHLMNSVASGLAKNSKEATRQFTALYKTLSYQRDFDIISEAEYYRELEALRDRYFGVGTENWVKYTKKIYSYQEKLLKEEKKAVEEEKKLITGMYDDIADYAIKRFDDIIKKQQNMATKLNDVGGLFKKNTVIMNGTTDTYYSLNDLDRDIETINRYNELLKGIESRGEGLGIDRGLIDGFLSVVREMDIEDAIGISNALMVSRDKQFAHYLSDWNTKELLSDKVAAGQYEREFSAGWDDAYENMTKELEKAGYEIPEGFFKSGSISAEKFGDAFCEGLELQMQRIRNIVDEFNASLKVEIPAGNVYNTTNNSSYNITGDAGDTVEKIRRYDTVKRLSGV